MIKYLVTTLSVMCLASAHEIHTGQCPGFTPMAGFDWEKVSIASCLSRGRWCFILLYCCVHKTLLRRILQLSLITVFRRSLVRDGEVWHQGNLFDLSVQNWQSRLQIRRAGKICSSRSHEFRDDFNKDLVFRLIRLPTQTSSGLTTTMCEWVDSLIKI